MTIWNQDLTGIWCQDQAIIWSLRCWDDFQNSTGPVDLFWALLRYDRISIMFSCATGKYWGQTKLSPMTPMYDTYIHTYQLLLLALQFTINFSSGDHFVVAAKSHPNSNRSLMCLTCISVQSRHQPRNSKQIVWRLTKSFLLTSWLSSRVVYCI